jgi:predicted phage terminase large subunit-like protein
LGTLDRVMVLMPPGSAKSKYASQIFPAHYLCRYPRANIIGASHTAELADTFGRRVRALVEDNTHVLGYRLRADSRAAGRWDTDKGGEYYATGVGGAVTGRRADLIIIDDPVKNRAEAESEVVRNATWEWYRSALYTRLKPGGRIVLIMTRWHEDDLGGRLLAEAEVGGDIWHVLDLRALSPGAGDPLGRPEGEPLWPEWEGKEALERKRQNVGERDWAALFQQSPRPLVGSIFKPDQINVIDAIPAGTIFVRAWDLAATGETATRDADYTAGVLLGRTPIGRFVVADVVRRRGGPDEVVAMIRNAANLDGREVPLSIPQDPGQAGKSQTLFLARQLNGLRVLFTPETGDKAERAFPIASQCNIGNMDVVRAPWNRQFLDELAAFPNGVHDDQVDALSRAHAHPTMTKGRRVPLSAAEVAAQAARRILRRTG